MTTQAFIHEDYPKTLFPNRTGQLLIQNGEHKIKDHIAKCFLKSEPSFSFLPQQRVYAAKHDLNLRRTVKLDPVAEYYIYDVTSFTDSGSGHRIMRIGPTSDTVIKKARS
jgi:hypothetical protein